MGLSLVVSYAVMLTGVVIALEYRRRGKEDLVVPAMKFCETVSDPSKKLEALLRVAQIQQANIPWYERTLSLLGVVAFFSMLVATGVQTTRATVESQRSEQLRHDVASLEAQRTNLDNLLSDVARISIEQFRLTGRVSRTGEDVLRYRLERLERLRTTTREEAVEEYEIALILKDVEKAVGVLESSLELLDTANPADRITVAEYYYMTGAGSAAARLIGEIEPRLSTLPTLWQVRALFIRAALDPSGQYDRELASLLQVDLPEARIRLERELRRLNASSEVVQGTSVK